jgi:hypothetical protein
MMPSFFISLTMLCPYIGLTSWMISIHSIREKFHFLQHLERMPGCSVQMGGNPPPT